MLSWFYYACEEKFLTLHRGQTINICIFVYYVEEVQYKYKLVYNVQDPTDQAYDILMGKYEA